MSHKPVHITSVIAFHAYALKKKHNNKPKVSPATLRVEAEQALVTFAMS